MINLDGIPVAFAADAAGAALRRGEAVEFAGVRVTTDGAGLLAESTTGRELPSHQAFWFAWSQFRPGTAVWPGEA